MITEQLTLTYISTTSSIEQCLSIDDNPEIDDEELATFELNNDVSAGMGDDHRMTPYVEDVVELIYLMRGDNIQLASH